MTKSEQGDLLDAVVEAVLHCPQLKGTVLTCKHCGEALPFTLGQRVHAAKQIRMAVARAMAATATEKTKTVAGFEIVESPDMPPDRIAVVQRTAGEPDKLLGVITNIGHD